MIGYLFLILVALLGVDAYITYKNSNAGKQDFNPIVRFVMEKFGIKGVLGYKGVTAVAAGATYFVASNYVTVVFIAFCLTAGGFVTNNVLNLRKTLKLQKK